MTELEAKMHFKHTDGSLETAVLYSTTSEAGAKYVCVAVGGNSAYAPLGAVSDSRATRGRVKKEGTDYAILSGWGEKRVLIQRTKNAWYSYVGGQGNTAAAYAAGNKILDDYEANKADFVTATDGEYEGHGIAYRTTVYNSFRIYSFYQHPDMKIDIKFTTTDGGNGTVTWSGLRTHSQWHKDFVIAGYGGDKGHYGEGLVEIKITAPGIKDISYTGRFWINSD